MGRRVTRLHGDGYRDGHTPVSPSDVSTRSHRPDGRTWSSSVLSPKGKRTLEGD